MSEREKFEISARYYEYATGEVDKLIEVAELWKQTYPPDAIPHNLLALSYHATGRHEKAMEEKGIRRAASAHSARAGPPDLLREL